MICPPAAWPPRPHRPRTELGVAFQAPRGMTHWPSAKTPSRMLTAILVGALGTATAITAPTAADAASPAATATAPADPLQAPACRAAVAALQSREAALWADRQARPPSESRRDTPAPDARLATLRSAAAGACLAGRPDGPAPRAGRRAEPPISLTPAPSPAPAPASRPAPTARSSPGATVPQAPPQRRAPPPATTLCDAQGCWASDGTRLDRFGPNLLGPKKGVCTLQGSLLHCP